MSGGYAERLTFRPPEMLGGKLGEAEKFDSDQVLRAQVSELAQWIRQSKRGVTVFTGAGISTATAGAAAHNAGSLPDGPVSGKTLLVICIWLC